ncbi:DUF6066 family protein [Archangium primigenium]|uniref:DUF6066 family protein n=1 Tax=[Archangium] primigenium TaxID=2792470 RepID=UPI0019579B2B|nr:hypothetical protein [Archangium primigenium]
MRRLLLAVLLLPTLALADVDSRFAQLRDQAEALGSLGTFLDKYVGECSGFFSGLGCRGASEEFRKQYEGKKLYMIVGESAASMVQPGPYQPGSGNYTILVTPSFPGGSYFLTQGAPSALSAEDQPLVAPIRVTGTTPEGWNATDFMRLFSSRKVRMQLVFSPEGIWGMERNQGRGKLYGVSCRVEGVLLSNATTGKPLGMWVVGDANRK